jgi:hypothetical protein
MIYLSKTKPNDFMKELLRGPAFKIGRVLITRKAKRRLSNAEIRIGLYRHIHEDLGPLPFDPIIDSINPWEDQEPIRSIYSTSKYESFEVITNPSRTRTIVCLVGEF